MNKKAIVTYLRENPALLGWSLTLFTALILAVTLLPTHLLVKADTGILDKFAHVLIFGGWTFLFGMYRLIISAGTSSLFAVFVAGLAFGAATELLQHVLPVPRSAEILDIVFDGIGSLIAVLVLYKLFK